MSSSSSSSRSSTPASGEDGPRRTVFRKEYDYSKSKASSAKVIRKPSANDTRPIDILSLLLKARKEEEDAILKAENGSIDASDADDGDDRDSNQNIDNIQKVRKERVFEHDVTEVEMDIIQQRIAFQQRQFAAYEQREKLRKYKRLKQHFGYLVEAEIDEALEECANDEDECLVQFSTRGYLEKIRRNIAIKNHKPATVTIMDDRQRARYEEHLKKRREAPRMRTTETQRKHYRMGGRLGLDEALKQVQENNVDASKAFEGWSDARVKAYQAIDKKPNTYYYRFNAPGEEQRKGAWTREEQRLFHDRLAEIGANGQWGLFSMTIPGRVGYQCSNYYRLLVETNQINDPNYVLDEKGKAHYLFDKKGANGETTKEFRTHSKHNMSGEREEKPVVIKARPIKPPKEPKEPKPPKPPKAPKEPKPPKVPKATAAATRKKRKRRAFAGSDDSEEISDFDCDNSGSYQAKSWGTTKRTRTRGPAAGSSSNGAAGGSGGDDDDENCEDEESDDDVDMTNPLPGFIDPITLEVVEKPAISKYGHVMGYDSWIRCLMQEGTARNICPLTKKPMTKRDVTVLTFENIEEYRDKIVNM